VNTDDASSTAKAPHLDRSPRRRREATGPQVMRASSSPPKRSRSTRRRWPQVVVATRRAHVELAGAARLLADDVLVLLDVLAEQVDADGRCGHEPHGRAPAHPGLGAREHPVQPQAVAVDFRRTEIML